MTIHQNLKKLRQLTGMTQEDVAARVGLTRQAISGYESGRRQPDMEMLERFAALYETDILEILYGTSAKQTAWRRFRRAASVTFVLPLLLLLHRSCILLGMNRLFPLVEGSFVLTEATRPMLEAQLETRRFLLAIGDTLGTLSGISSLVGCAALAVLTKPLHPLPSGRTSLLYGLLFLLGTVICTAPFSLWDPVYTTVYYMAFGLNTVLPISILGICRLFLGWRQPRDNH